MVATRPPAAPSQILGALAGTGSIPAPSGIPGPPAQVEPGDADFKRVRFERMVIEAGSNTFSLIAHPRLTVIAGVGHVERDALVGELLGSLGSARSGVHVELVDDTGRRLAVFRPRNGRHLVVDIDRTCDVSDE